MVVWECAGRSHRNFEGLDRSVLKCLSELLDSGIGSSRIQKV